MRIFRRRSRSRRDSTLALPARLESVVRVMKTAENSTSYSINNTARQVLWLPTTTEMKYKAKPAIETLFVRLGDGLATVTVLFGMRFFALSTRSFFLFNVVLGVLWLSIALLVVRDYGAISELGDATSAR